MPYKERDAFRVALREYLKENCISLPESTEDQYRRWIEEAGELVDFKNPRNVTLGEMRMVEQELEGNETSRSVKASTFRHFLRYSGNSEANKWKLSCKQRPKEDGVFFNEEQTAYLRSVSQSLGVDHELIFSLGIDNGLRTIDMRRLTVEMEEKLQKAGEATILGKGRNGGKPGKLTLNKMTFAPLVAYSRKRKELVEQTGQDSEKFLVKLDRDGQLIPMKYWYIEYLCGDISKKSGLDFAPHDLRRSFGHRLHLKKVPLETIAKLMRHDNPNQSFKSYIGWDKEELREAVDLLCPDKTSQQSVVW